jgi:glycosyltransferase involved in cell wall biosynthesis
VIPVYNSEQIVSDTIDRTVAFFENEGLDYEIVLVNDCSPDNSWDVLREKAAENDRIKAIHLLKNYGQHTAVFCGLANSSGDWIVTLDDDLQNPPEEIKHLISKAAEGFDLVFGQFKQKKHNLIRRLGSKGIGLVNRRIFHKPEDLVLSNFRLIRRDVVDRMVAYRTPEPYIPGLSLMFSHRRANTPVEHHPRSVGKSNYGIVRIFELVMRILFNYSAFPLRLVSGMGALVSVGSLATGVGLVVRRLLLGSDVPGWTSLVVLLSLFNGFTILLLSMLGEYTVRLIAQTSSGNNYYVKESLNTEAR